MNGHYIQNDTPILPRIPKGSKFDGSNASPGSGYSTASGTIRGATMKRGRLVQSYTTNTHPWLVEFLLVKTIICAKQELAILLFWSFCRTARKFPEKTNGSLNNSKNLDRTIPLVPFLGSYPGHSPALTSGVKAIVPRSDESFLGPRSVATCCNHLSRIFQMFIPEGQINKSTTNRTIRFSVCFFFCGYLGPL